MALTARCRLPYPNEDSDPWFDSFESMLLAIDSSLYAAREDRNAVFTSEASFSFTASSGVLSWDNSIQIFSPITGYYWTVPANSTILAAGQALYITVTRNPQSTSSYTTSVGSVIPGDVRGDDQFILCVRVGNSVYFRNGAFLSDGDSRGLFGTLSIAGTGLLKAVSGTLQSVASLLVNADVDPAAAIAGTKISPNFGAQNISTTGIVSLGTTPAVAGQFRLPNNPGVIVSQRNGSNTNDIPVVSANATEAFFATDTSYSLQSINARIYASSAVYSGVGSTTISLLDSTGLQLNDKNFSLGASPTYGGGSIVAFLKNATTNPTTNPTGGIVAYVDAADGYLKYRRTDGTVVNLNGIGAPLTISGTGLLKAVGGTIQSTATLLVDADVNAAAAIAGTKISPDFGSQNITTTGVFTLGTTTSATGSIRVPINTDIIKFRNSSNTGDLYALATNASNEIFLGTSTGFTSQATNVRIYATTAVYLGSGSNNILQLDGTNGIQPWGSNAISFVAAHTNAKVRQLDNTTASATAQTLTIQAQNATGTTSTGGALILTSGTGTSANGAVNLQIGGTNKVVISSSLVTSADPIATGTNPATTGQIRLPNNAFVFGRNVGNTADLQAIGFDTANNLVLGAISSQGNTIISAPSAQNVQIGGRLTVANASTTTTNPILFSSGTVALSGQLRFVNNVGTIAAMRNAGNTADLVLFATNTTDGYIGCDTSLGNALSNLTLGTATVVSKATTFIESGNSKLTDTNVKASIQTTDATVTNLYTWTIPTGISSVDVVVTGIKSDNSAGAMYKRSIVFRNNAGTVTTIGTVTDNGTFEDVSAWDCTIDNSTTTGRVKVTGAAATNITWSVSQFRHEQIA